MNLYVIRHTHVAVGKGVCYGQADVALANSFGSELSTLQARLPKKFDAIISSDASRCLQLANAIGNDDIPVKQEARLRELNFGEWELQTWDAIFTQDNTHYEQWAQDFINTAPPQGESLQTMYARVIQAIETIRTSHDEKQNILVVTHAGVIRCLWCYVLGYPLANFFKLPVGYGEVLQLSLARDAQYDRIAQKA